MAGFARRSPAQSHCARLIAVLLLQACLSLSGCALPGLASTSTVRSAPTATPESPLAQLTVYSVEGGFLSARRLSDGMLRWRYPKPEVVSPPSRGPSMLAPLAVDGAVYGGDLIGGVFALRARDGQGLWHIQLDTPVVRLAQRNVSEYTIGYDQTPVQVEGELLYVTPMALQNDQHNDLFALNRSDGSTRWRSPLWFGSPPLISAGIAYVGATLDYWTRGEVLALDATSGAQLWRIPLADCPRPQPLASADGLLYVGPCGGTDVVALRATTGAIAWRTRTQTPVSYVDGASVAGGLVVVSNQSGLYALDAHTGALRWSHVLQGSGGPLATGDTVFSGTADRCLYAFDIATGAVRWRTSAFADQPCMDPPYPDTVQRSIYTAPVLADGILCTDAALWPVSPMPYGFKQPERPGVVALNWRDGSIRWRASTVALGELTGPPMVAPSGT